MKDFIILTCKTQKRLKLLKVYNVCYVLQLQTIFL